MCSKCFNELDYLATMPNRITEGKKVYCAGVYSKNLQKLIRGLKYHNQRELAYYLAKFMFQYWLSVTDDTDFQVVPVPIYYKRKKKRKYNHMELVGTELCRLGGYSYNPELITRIKDTKPQYKLSKKERFNNLNNAFKVDKSKLQSGKILIIDDIITTGNTLGECSGMLVKSGCSSVDCAVLCSVIMS